MNRQLMRARSGSRTGLAAATVGLVAVVCCAGAPLIAGLVGGIAVGSVLGVGAGVLALIVVAAVVAWRARRRRGYAASASRSHGGSAP